MANQNDNDRSARLMTPKQLVARLEAGEKFELADDLPYRIDDETRDASEEYYARKHRRNMGDLDSAVGLLRILAVALVCWAAGYGAWRWLT